LALAMTGARLHAWPLAGLCLRLAFEAVSDRTSGRWVLAGWRLSRARAFPRWRPSSAADLAAWRWARMADRWGMALGLPPYDYFQVNIVQASRQDLRPRTVSPISTAAAQLFFAIPWCCGRHGRMWLRNPRHP